MLSKTDTYINDLYSLSKTFQDTYRSDWVHFYTPDGTEKIGGRVGTSHGADIYVTEPERACVKSAKWQVTMLKLLLENDAERAKTILKNFTPLFKSKEEFLKFQDSLNCSGNRIIYKDDGTAEIKL